jgi:hypothetical protein
MQTAQMFSTGVEIRSKHLDDVTMLSDITDEEEWLEQKTFPLSLPMLSVQDFSPS